MSTGTNKPRNIEKIHKNTYVIRISRPTEQWWPLGTSDKLSINCRDSPSERTLSLGRVNCTICRRTNIIIYISETRELCAISAHTWETIRLYVCLCVCVFIHIRLSHCGWRIAHLDRAKGDDSNKTDLYDYCEGATGGPIQVRWKTPKHQLSDYIYIVNRFCLTIF